LSQYARVSSAHSPFSPAPGSLLKFRLLKVAPGSEKTDDHRSQVGCLKGACERRRATRIVCGGIPFRQVQQDHIRIVPLQGLE